MRSLGQSGHPPAEESLIRVCEHRTRSLESQVAMALGIAHELNNVTACILGNNTILIRNLSAGSPLEENAREVEVSANNAVDLAKQLTFFSGKAKVNAVALNLSELVHDLEPDLAAMVGPDAGLHLKLQSDMPAVKADPGQIRIVVCNLVQNAADFLSNGKGSVTVRTGVIDSGVEACEKSYFEHSPTSGRHAFIEVVDTGRGILAAAMDRIFEPFFTTKMRAQGLGLSVAIGIVRAHCGAVTVQSVPDHGSTFRLLLPCLV